MLHDEIRPSLKFRYFVDGDNIGMFQTSGSLGLTLESFAAIFILTKIGWEKFESDFAIKLGILRQIHFAHPTGTDLLDDAVVGDQRPGYNIEKRSRPILAVICRRHEQLPQSIGINYQS